MLDAIPPDALVDDVAILGKKGAGKTHTARGEAEQLLDAGRRVCVIDPTGVWFGLRLQPDGKTPSPYQVVVFGGDHGDIALEGASGTKLAELIAGADFSAIIDTKRLTVGERTRIFTEFAERLAQVNRKPLHLIIDEAHLFAPQGRVNDPQSGRMVHAANNLVSGGRALGIRIMLITQRPAKLHKDSLSGVETLVAMRMVAPQDRAAVEDWIRAQADPVRGREIVASLPSLPTGEGWIWSPQLDVLERAKFRPIRTFDSSRTPIDGAPEAAPVRLEALDLALLQAALLPPDQTQGPAARGDRRQRSSEGSTPSRPTITAADLAAAERHGYERGVADAKASLEHVLGGAEIVRDAIAEYAAELEAFLGRPLAGLGTAPAPSFRTEMRAQALAGARARNRSSEQASPRSGATLEGRLLEALRRAARPDSTLDEAAVLAIASPISGPTRVAKNAVLASGEVTAPDASKRVLVHDWRGETDPLIGDDVVAAWRMKLGGMAAEILFYLFEHPQPAKKAAIADELGRSAISGPWRGAWKTLRNNLLVEDAGDGLMRLARVLRDLPRKAELAA